MSENSTDLIEIQAEPDATTLSAIVDTMRSMIRSRRDLWPQMMIRYGAAWSTLQGLSGNYPLYQNPTLQTLIMMENLCRMIDPSFLGPRPEVESDL